MTHCGRTIKTKPTRKNPLYEIAEENNDAYCGFREEGAGETPQALLHDMSAVWCEEPLEGH